MGLWHCTWPIKTRQLQKLDCEHGVYIVFKDSLPIKVKWLDSNDENHTATFQQHCLLTAEPSSSRQHCFLLTQTFSDILQISASRDPGWRQVNSSIREIVQTSLLSLQKTSEQRSDIDQNIPLWARH